MLGGDAEAEPDDGEFEEVFTPAVGLVDDGVADDEPDDGAEDQGDGRVDGGEGAECEEGEEDGFADCLHREFHRGPPELMAKGMVCTRCACARDEGWFGGMGDLSCGHGKHSFDGCDW